MKFKLVDIPVFDTETTFMYDCSQDEFNNYIESLGCEKVTGSFDGAVVELPNGMDYIVYIGDIYNPRTVFHEIYHVVGRICETRGIPTFVTLPDGRPADETGAYLAGEFAARVWSL